MRIYLAVMIFSVTGKAFELVFSQDIVLLLPKAEHCITNSISRQLIPKGQKALFQKAWSESCINHQHSGECRIANTNRSR